MDSLRKEIDKGFKPYEFRSGVEELFVRYKRRKKRIKAFFMSICTVSVVLVTLIIWESAARIGTAPASGLGLSVSAFSVETSFTELSAEKKLIADSGGVMKQIKKTSYDKNGVEILNGKKGNTYFKRTVITPSPLTLKIKGKDILSFRARCSSNGSLYNERNDNIGTGKLLYKENKSISWIPNCNKLSASLGADNSKIPSTLEVDKRVSEKLASLLKTEEDYNYYFGDTIKITAECKDKSVETVSVNITLDDKGRYYISTVK